MGFENLILTYCDNLRYKKNYLNDVCTQFAFVEVLTLGGNESRKLVLLLRQV